MSGVQGRAYADPFRVTHPAASLPPVFFAVDRHPIIVSLLGPIETFAAPPPDEPPIHATQCPDGTLWNNQTQQCDPLPDIPAVDPNDDQDPACGEGEVPNGTGGRIPDQQPT